MKFPSNPHYSNTVIKKAGEDVRTKPKKSDEYDNAVLLINNWRLAHGFPMSVIAKSLRVRTEPFKNAIVAQRLKRLPTIVNKLSRQPSMALPRMQDIGGTRAIVNSIDEVYEIVKYYQASKKFSQFIKVRDYIQNPKPGGYRGIHVIFKFDSGMSQSRYADDYAGLAVEAQIRTQIQHAWATSVETMSTMRGEDYKSGFGDKSILEFFELTSVAFALLEDSVVQDQYKQMNILEVGKKMIKLDKAKRLSDQITGYAYAAQVIDSKRVGGDYNLITLNIKERTVDIMSFDKTELKEASLAYKNMEDKATIDENIETVLVSAGKLKSLMLAYPNYFLDISSFHEKIGILYSVLESNEV